MNFQEGHVLEKDTGGGGKLVESSMGTTLLLLLHFQVW